MVAAGGIARPADLLQAVDVEAEKHPHDAEIIVEVAQIDHPAGNRVEPGAGAQELQEFRAAVAEKGDKRLGAEQVKERTDQGSDDQADDLILRLDADIEADGDIGRREKERGDITADDRPPVKRADEAHGQRQRQGQEQRQADQFQTGQELAQHQGPRRHRAGEQEFERPRPPLFRPQPHGHRRGEEDQQDRHPAKEWPYFRDVAREKSFNPEEDEQGHRQEDPDKDKGDRSAEKCIELLFGYT